MSSAPEPAASPADIFQADVDALLTPAHQLGRQEAAVIRRVAERFADVLQAGRSVYAFGAGHSKAVADELCHRAGGLPGFVSMSLEDLRTEPRAAHRQLSDSQPERTPHLGADLLARYAVDSGDGLLIASQSGRNGAIVEMARVARESGVYVAALVSRQHAANMPSRHRSGLTLIDHADDVIDNHGPIGDATIVLRDADRVGSVSTIAGALVAQLISVSVARILAARGHDPQVIRSANVDPPAPA